MKLVLCLVFCLGSALARVEDWSWMNDGKQRDRRTHLKNSWGRNTEESRNNWWGSSDDDETTGTTCQVSGRKVNTFRNVEVSVPLTTEYVVLSKDCSSNPSFVVMIRKLSQRTDLKQLKVQTRTHKVVITPMSQSGEQMRITVNDRPVRINEDIVLKENGSPVIRLIKEGSECRVQLLNKDITVVFDGYTCNVELSQVSRKLMCGLCGQTNSKPRSRDFTNTENFNDFYGQDEDTEYPEDKEFDEEFNTCSNKRQWWADKNTCQKNRRQWGYDKPEWNVDESECNREYKPFETEFDSEYTPFESKYNTRDYSELTEEQSDDYETEYKPFQHKRFESEYKPFESKFNSWEQPEWTNEQSDEYETEFDQSSSRKRIVLKHKLINLEDKICVSLQRIPKCPVNTRPVNQIQKRVSFHCINRNDPRVSKFEDKIQSGERIPEIQRLTPSLTRTVVVPTKCTKSFY